MKTKKALEYQAFLRDKNDFLNKPDVFGGEKSGLLVVQDFENENRGTELGKQKGPIRIVEVSKLKENIEDIIGEKINLDINIEPNSENSNGLS